MTDVDVLVIGAGHNGLVCATQLASAGRSVMVLEAGEQPGGMAVNREIAPGFQVPGCAQWLTQFSPQLIRELKLEQHGLELAATDLTSIGLSADGNTISLKQGEVSGEISDADRAAFAELYRLLSKVNRLLLRLSKRPPPYLVEGKLRDKLALADLGLRLRLMGSDDMSELLRQALNNVYDLLQERFESPLLKGMLSLEAVQGTHFGPRSPNTVFTLLQRKLQWAWGGEVSQVRGGMAGLGTALANAAQAAGVTLRYGAEVKSLNMPGDRVEGVQLADGAELRAGCVVSSVDPVTTFESLLGLAKVETDTARRVSQIRTKSGTAKLHLALSGLPNFTGLDASQLGQRLLIAPAPNYVERAFNPVKYGEYASLPTMDISIPSVNDPSLAPDGQHVLSAIVQHVSHSPAGGWSTQRERALSDWIDCLAQYAPDIREHIVAAEILTPADLEQQYRVQGGHWDHAEISLDQVLMMRPFPAAARYDASVPGLYLCGAGSHPGGNLSGLPGRNAADTILKMEKQS